MPKDYEVKNLLNEKKVILAREDIFKIAKYAIENEIIDVTWFEVDSVDYTSLQNDITIDDFIFLDSEEVGGEKE